MPTVTDNLELYKPDSGQSGVAAQLNTNLDKLDGRFDEATGHTHDGTEGEGPKLPVTSLQTGGTPSASTYLRGDGMWATGTGSGTGVTDHADLTGLADDEHPQYFNQSRGDTRYTQRANNLSDVTSAATARANLGAAAATHQHAGADITTGTVATARLGSGTANATTYLRGDQTWQPVSGSGGAGTLDDLTDVLIVTPSDNQVLTYDAVGGRWENATPEAVTVDPEIIDDRVNALIVAGTGITKTYDDAANTLTLAATGGGGGTIDPVTTLRAWDDFLLVNTTSGNIGTLGWGTTNGQSVPAPSVANHPGVLERNTTTTINTVSSIHLDSATGFGGNMWPADTFDVTWVVALKQNDANIIVRCGLAQNTGNPPTNAIYLEKMDSDTSWFGVTRAGSTQTRTAALAATSTNYVKLRCRRVNATTIGFSVDGGTEATLTATIPTVVLSPILQIVNTAAASKAVNIDLFSMTISNLVR